MDELRPEDRLHSTFANFYEWQFYIVSDLEKYLSFHTIFLLICGPEMTYYFFPLVL